jgi:cytochrome c-type biogenesis protein CcmF
MGIGPLCQWQQMPLPELIKKIRFLLLASILLGIVLPLIFSGMITLTVAFGLSLALWVIITTLKDFYQRMKTVGGIQQGLKKLPRSQFGMLFAHLGIAICVIGVTLTTTYSSELAVRMIPGDKAKLGNYVFSFQDINPVNGPNYQALRADFGVWRNGQLHTLLKPEKRYYSIDNMSTSIPAISIGLFRDLYLVLGEPLGNNAWAVRIYDKPFVRWIWWGGFIMLFGGILALTDQRYRKKRVSI